MKKILSFLLFIFSVALNSAYAQIPNNEFENWTVSASYDSLVFWSTDNFLVSTCAQKEASIIQSGSLSLRLTTSAYPFGIATLALPGAASTGGFTVNGPNIDLAQGGQPDAIRHAFLKGYYKYSSVGGAHGSIETVLYKNNGTTRDTVGYAIWQVSDASNYTFFSIPLVYNSPNDPDTAIVYFQSSSRVLTDLLNLGTLGSQLFVDSVYYDGLVGINEPGGNLISLVSFPNPATDYLVIETKWNTPVKGSVSIFDIKGKLIEQIPMTNEKQRVDLSGFSNGSYFYDILDERGNRLNSGKFSVSK